MGKVWNAPDLIEEVEGKIDELVEAAVTDYVNDGFLTFTLEPDGRDLLEVLFQVADPLDHLEKRVGLYELIVKELDLYRPRGEDPLFFDPGRDKDTPKVRLLQALVRAYQECGAVPAEKDEPVD